QPGGVEDAIAALKSQGLTAAQVLELIGGLSIEPVFAPHSTEASRRTLLRKQLRIAQRLVERLDPTLTPNEARGVWNSIRMELTAAWQTEELPRERLTVADEREQILFYLVEVLYRVVPAFYEEIAQALEKLYGTNAGLFYVERLLRRIDTFGFHLATLDVRQHAGVLHEVVARGFDDPLWPGRSSRERRDRLAQALEKDRGPVADLDALGKRHLAVFDAIMQGRHRDGPDPIGYFIVSGASGADAVLAPLLRARWAAAH